MLALLPAGHEQAISGQAGMGGLLDTLTYQGDTDRAR